MKTIWTNIKNWAVEYFFVPVSLLFIWAAVDIHYFMTGRPSGEDPWSWIIGTAPRIFAAIVAIALVSLTREATGVWLTKQEKLKNPAYASIQAICSSVLLIVFFYFLAH